MSDSRNITINRNGIPVAVWIAGLFAILLWFACGSIARAVTLLEDQNFTGASGSSYGSWAIQGTGAAFISATQADSTTGTVVQLTPATNDRSGTLVYDSAFSSSLGVQVIFDYYIGGGTGADGLSFFLVDGTETSVTPGKAGGTLGYGTNYSTISGVPNAYMAVGFDIYGNGRNEFGNSAGTGANNGGLLTNNLLLVGSGNTTSGYRYLSGSQQSTIGGGWRQADITVERGDGTNGCTSGGTCVSVRFSTNNGTSWTTVYTDQRIDNATGQASIPDTFKLGFSGSTGGSNNKHYIDNVKIYLLQNGYQLTAAKSGSGSGTITSTSSPTQSTQINCGSTCAVAFLQDTVVTLTVAAASGSEFTGWSGDCSGTSTVVAVTMSAAKTCTAAIAAIYTVSTSGGAGGSITPTSASVTDGNTTSFTVTPSTGYSTNTVSGCGGSLSGTTYTTGAITSACTVTASFSLNSYTVSTSAGGGGSISPTSASVNHGSTTSFTITPDSNYTIGSVSGCGGSLSGSTYTTGAITGACTVTASFSLNSYTVSTSAGGGGSISPTSASVNHGSTTSLTVTPNSGYSITSVSGCGGSLSGTTYTTGAITGACTVTASFSSAGNTHVKSGGGALGWLPLTGLLLLALRRHARCVVPATALLIAVMPIPTPADNGWYAGFQGGRANTDTDATEVAQEIAARGISGTVSISDSTRNAWKAYGGYEYHQHLAVETGYTNLGRIDTSFDGAGLVGLSNLEGALPASGTGFELVAVGRYPLTDRLTGFGRAGLWHWKARYQLTDANGNVSTTKPTGTNTIFGLGLEAHIQDSWSARLAWDRYRIHGNHSDFINLGAIYRFAR